MAILTGLALAAIYTLCVVIDLLLPGQFQIYRLWEQVLISVTWAAPWTLLFGLVEVFLYGAIGAWAFAARYQRLRGRVSR